MLSNNYLPREEKYPNISQEEFIPIEYIHPSGVTIPGDIYVINKIGEVKNIKTGKILKITVNKNYCRVFLKFSDKRYNIFLHRLVASTFLKNPDLNIYSVVNHIDHDPKNNNLSNLEWVTSAENNNKVSGKSISIDINKLIQFIALNDSGEEVFRFNRKNNGNYVLESIRIAIKHNRKYKGYYWKVENKKDRIIHGFSGNLNDYEWYEHWKYPGLYVCKEGFLKYRERLLYSLDKDQYVRITFNKDSLRVHRIIMEFILKRNLTDGEVVDHINTIPYDNRFSNLRVTNQKGNMNNQTTREKLFKNIVLCNLYGDFLDYISSEELSKKVLNKSKESNKFNRTGFLYSNTVSKRFICIEVGDSFNLYKKMETIVYVFNKDKTEVLGAFTSVESVKSNDNLKVLQKDAIRDNYLNKNKLDKYGNYYMRGPKAVELVLSLGHGTAKDFLIE